MFWSVGWPRELATFSNSASAHKHTRPPRAARGFQALPPQHLAGESLRPAAGRGHRVNLPAPPRGPKRQSLPSGNFRPARRLRLGPGSLSAWLKRPAARPSSLPGLGSATLGRSPRPEQGAEPPRCAWGLRGAPALMLPRQQARRKGLPTRAPGRLRIPAAAAPQQLAGVRSFPLPPARSPRAALPAGTGLQTPRQRRQSSPDASPGGTGRLGCSSLRK